MRAATAEIPAHIKADAVAVDLYRDLMLQGLEDGQIRQLMTTPAFAVMLERRKVMTYTAELHGWDAIDKQKLQTLAILEGFEVQKIDGQSQLVMPCNNTAGQTKCEIDLEKLQAILADVDGKDLVERWLNGSFVGMFSRISIDLVEGEAWYQFTDSELLANLFNSLMWCATTEPLVFREFVHSNPAIFDKVAKSFGGQVVLNGFLADAEANGWTKEGAQIALKNNVSGWRQFSVFAKLGVNSAVEGIFEGSTALAKGGASLTTDRATQKAAIEALTVLGSRLLFDREALFEDLYEAGYDVATSNQLAYALDNGNYGAAIGMVTPELASILIPSAQALKLRYANLIGDEALDIAKRELRLELFSKRPKSFDPIEPEQFARIKRALERQGRTIDDSEDALRYLEMREAEGVTFDAETIMVRPDASASTIFEELIHATQHKSGSMDRWIAEYGNAGAVSRAEYEAAKKLTRNQKAYGIADDEHLVNLTRVDQFREELKAMGIDVD